MRMPLSLCRAQENVLAVLAASWGEHFSAQSSHEFEVLSQPHQRKTALCFARARHAGGAPWSTRWPVADVSWRWHGITVPSHQGVKSKGKKLLKMQNATGLYWADFMQIRSDAFQSNVGDESCINLRVLHGFTVFLSRSPTHIPATRRPVLKLQNDEQIWQESTRVCRNARVCEDLVPILIVLRVF